MLSPDDIRAMGIRRYPSYLRALVMGEAFFPLKIPFGRPSTSDEWPKLQKEITALATGTVGYRIEWTTVNTRRWGEQRMPERVWFDDEATCLQALGKKTEVIRFAVCSHSPMTFVRSSRAGCRTMFCAWSNLLPSGGSCSSSAATSW